jgi:hypothetical protein
MLVNFKDCKITNNKVYFEEKVAVLISGGYGAGWHSWNKKNTDCLTNPQIVELVLEKESLEDELKKLNWAVRDKSEVKKKLTSKIKQIEELAETLYSKEFYSGGSAGLYIEWMEEGSQFKIEEYDGNESVLFRESNDWITV